MKITSDKEKSIWYVIKKKNNNQGYFPATWKNL